MEKESTQQHVNAIDVTDANSVLGVCVHLQAGSAVNFVVK